MLAIVFGIIGRGGGVDQGALAHLGEHRRGEGVPRTDDAAADYEHIQIENVDEIGHQDSQGNAESLEDALRVFVSLDGEVVD